ncbi:MAG TPA: acyltransferase [Alloacidobacterium sp.]|nr:acyltransferase [Alloacidobacterium sp.]
MASAAIVQPDSSVDFSSTPRFYRPELDALRLFAFFAVYLCHSIPNTLANQRGGMLAAIKDAGNFGVCLFFLLSSFLITELLRREYQRCHMIHVEAFYIRRILRIWPLYFGITLLYAIGGHFFHAMRMETARILAYFLLAGNWFIAFHPWIQTPLRSLWSISVEEQFYLVWPLIARYGAMRALMHASLVILPLSFLTICIASANPYAYNTVWLNSFTQFQFFAWGALLALALQGRIPHRPPILRTVMAATGIALWLVAACATNIKRPAAHASPSQFCFGYLLVAAGCILLLLAVLGVSSSRVPQSIAWLGKISFGLYVFHEPAFLIVDGLQKHLRLNFTASPALVINKAVALCITALLAAFSYRFWESPFLRLKHRFTWIRSREI